MSGNALDYSYRKFDQLPRLLQEFAILCVNAANVNPKYCPFASISMKSPDPASDILTRINNIITSLSQKAGYVNTAYKKIIDQTFTLENLVNKVYEAFWVPLNNLPYFAEYLLEAEISISTSRTAKRSISELDLSNQARYDSLAGFSNPFAGYARSCIDQSFQGIDNPTDFIEYFSGQLTKNPLVAYYGWNAAPCLSWPNLTSFNVERYRQPFPKATKNKLLVIGVTGDPTGSFSGAVATFNYIGSNNAVFLTHDAFGVGSIWQPNNCTTGAIKSYLLNGKLFANGDLFLGTLPSTGSICRSDMTGANNPFLIGQKLDEAQHEVKMFKLALAFGLGLGIPIVLVLSFLAGLCVSSIQLKRRNKAEECAESIKDVKFSGPS